MGIIILYRIFAFFCVLYTINDLFFKRETFNEKLDKDYQNIMKNIYNYHLKKYDGRANNKKV